VIARFPQTQYYAIGSGTDLERHKKLALEKGVENSVHFLGSVDMATLRDCYRNCDVFVMCSAREGFGIAYLEAMQYGKPVIAANSGGAPEVVKDCETGLLVDYGSANQIATAIIRLCSDSALRHKLGEAGRARVENNYTFEHFKQRLHKIILTELPPRAFTRDRQSVGLSNETP
jgi:glycosyltransferase involved in cell wall biosynthesis